MRRAVKLQHNAQTYANLSISLAYFGEMRYIMIYNYYVKCHGVLLFTLC